MVCKDATKTLDMMRDARLSELGEKLLLKHILDTLGDFEDLILPKGDDAAALELRGRLVIAVDMFVEKTDKPASMAWRYAGYKAVAAVLSDLAAKGAEPRYLLTSLGLRGDMLFREFEELWGGILECAGDYGVRVIGGDLSETEEVVVDVACIGVGGNLIPRGGARAGELVAVTGDFGDAGAALHALLNNIEADEDILMSFLKPRTRLREGRALAETGVVSACIDSSDGLAASLHHIAEASNVAIVVHKLPVSDKAGEYAEEHNLDLKELVLYSGEEYELVFTFSRDGLDRVREALDKVGCRLHVIGEVTKGRGVYLVDEKGGVEDIEFRGFEHLRA